jgi:ankyrin repeat protein
MNINQEFTLDIPIHFAVRQRDLKRIQELVNNGADINEQDGFGITALIVACCTHGDDETVEALLEDYKADVKVRAKDGSTALMYASAKGYFTLVRLLLDNSAEISAKDKDGKTALNYADDYGEVVIAKLLAKVAGQYNDSYK